MISLKFLLAIVSTLIMLAAVFIGFELKAQNRLNEAPPIELSFSERLKKDIDVLKIDLTNISLSNHFKKLPIGNHKKASFFDFKSLDELDPKIRERKPFTFSSPEVSSWKALKWDIFDLTYKYPSLEGVLEIKIDQERIKSGEFPLFVVENDSGNGGLIGEQDSDRPLFVEQMTFISLLLKIAEDKSKFLFFDDFKHMETVGKFVGDVQWRSLLFNEGFSASSNISYDILPPQFVLQSPSCAVRGKYSPSHRVFTQLKGHSRVFLYPPARAKDLYLFPSIHARDKHSQVNPYHELLNSEEENNQEKKDDKEDDLELSSDFPRFHKLMKDSKDSKDSSLYVDLSAGESLYTPPFWISIFENQDSLSYGVEVQSPSREQIILLEAYLMPLPFTNSNTTSLSLAQAASRVIASKIFLSHVLNRVTGFISNFKFAKALYKARYESIYPEHGVFLQRNKYVKSNNKNNNEDELSEEEVFSKANSETISGNFGCLRNFPKLKMKIGNQINKKLLIKGARYIADHVNNLDVPNPVKWVWLGDYVEQIARWAMGNPDRAVLFIRECFEEKTKMDTSYDEEEEVEGPGVLKLGKEHYKDLDEFHDMLRRDYDENDEENEEEEEIDLDLLKGASVVSGIDKNKLKESEERKKREKREREKRELKQ